MKFSSLIFCLFLALGSFGQTDTLQHRIFLVGDAGELHGGVQPVLDWLNKNVDWDDERNIVMYLGDNIYEYGLPMEGEADYQHYKSIIDYQINLVRGKKARAIFVPGNHDWFNGKIGGWQRVVNQVDYINGLGEPNIEAWPHGGCPGPVVLTLSEKVVITLVDSQWFLHVHEKPGPGSSCTARTIDEFETELREIMASHQNQLMIVAMHHPLYSLGPHGGGGYTWKDHLFPFTAMNPSLYIPLPVLGSIYPIARGVFGSLQDVDHPLYKTMSTVIERAMKQHPNPIHVSGHDHTLQMIMKDSIPYIVSGSAAKINRLQENPPVQVLFSDIDHGFATLEIRKSGNVESKFYTLASASLENPVFTRAMKKIDTLPEVIQQDSIPDLPDYVTVAANPKLKAGPFKRFLMGENYRAEWTTPVRMEVLDLGKEQGGLTPQRQGGGKQTRVLRMEDSTGKEWVLRSMHKFPDAAIPPDLRQTILQNMTEDGVSSSYPYANLSVPVMAHAAGVPSLRRKLVFIPDDPRLGRFRDNFKNTVATLQESKPGNLESFTTDDIVLKLRKENSNSVDQLQVLRARLLDNFYMDFDRHEEQWRWVSNDTTTGKVYYPVPRDVDQAFFVTQGIIPKLINKFSVINELQGFEDKADDIRTFNRAARNFDRFFLNQLDLPAWQAEIDSFLMRMTDSVIDAALNRQPPEIRDFHAAWIKKILQEKKRFFSDDMIRYYRFISKEVNILGSGFKEQFNISKQDDGSVQVVVSRLDGGNQGSYMYERTFDPSITREINIYGLEDADSFVVSGGITPIKIRIIGGPGNDRFHNEASGKVDIYDVTFEENSFSGNKDGFRMKLSNTPEANEYARSFFKYNSFSNALSFAGNVDDGLLLGLESELITQGFRKEPFASKHVLDVKHAFRTSSWRFKYNADFTNVIGKTDFIIRSDVRAPVNVTNFFGLGNNAVFDKNKENAIDYYRARYDMAKASFLFRRQLQSWMRVGYGLAMQYFHVEPDKNTGRYVTNTAENGLNPENLYNHNWYVGAESTLELNSRNNPVMPTRGVLVNASLKPLIGISGSSNALAQFNWDMSVMASFGPKAVTVYALRFGVASNFGDFKFPQAHYLGGTENLRGYRRDRFGGRTVLYQNTELRFRALEFNTYLFPGSLGLLAFHDIGRVWMDGEASRRWHNGYGAGIWLSPIKRFVVTGSLTFSKEEKALPYFTFGFQF